MRMFCERQERRCDRKSNDLRKIYLVAVLLEAPKERLPNNKHVRIINVKEHLEHVLQFIIICLGNFFDKLIRLSEIVLEIFSSVQDLFSEQPRCFIDDLCDVGIFLFLMT